MRKDEMKHRWDEQKIRWFLQESAEEEAVPESLRPKQMEEWLRQQSERKEKTEDMDPAFGQETKSGAWWGGALMTAACLICLLFTVERNLVRDDVYPGTEETEDSGITEEMEDSDITEGGLQEGTTYAKLYQSFEKSMERQREYDKIAQSYEENVLVGASDDAAADDTYDMDAEAADTAYDAAADDTYSIDRSEESKEDYGKTNRQEESVEEADIIKNDGRYLYRVVRQSISYDSKYAVNIIDTEGGLKKMTQVGSFDEVDDIYVWKDKLLVIEPKWAQMEDTCGVEDGSEDVWISSNAYCRIFVYDISDRANPKEYHTFTVKGNYRDSRISNGYLYFFASCDVENLKSRKELRAYVPMLDGELLAEDKITLPEGSEATSYLVMASVDLEQPDEYADTRALVTSADRFYVSPGSIYVTDTRNLTYGKVGNQTDSTILYRYSYKNGKMKKEAKGVVKGILQDDMAMNEYRGNLRMVTTVNSQNIKEVTDDITGELIGYDDVEEQTTNSLYVLDSNLKTIGMLEDLAPDERVYSARFMGDSGYFVTFRETDPLFSVDLTNPKEPKILGELKISGFSEYLHFYADNLLLGIGMEADEESGETSYLKLSMFDISDPSDVREQSKLILTGYDSSEALYNYKDVLIDTKKNLFGFLAESYDSEMKMTYMLFKYEDGEFQKLMEIDCSDNSRYLYNTRGTFIGDRFFLLTETGWVEEYSLSNGSKTGELKP